MENKHPRADALAAVVLLIIVVPFMATVHEIYIDPFDPGFGARDFPIGVIAMIIVLSATMLFNSIRELKRQGLPLIDKEALAPVLAFGGMISLLGIAYIWLFTLMQYLMPTALALALIMALFGNRGWVRLGLIPVIAALAYYIFFFVLLDLHEFPGTLIRYDGKSFFSI